MTTQIVPDLRTVLEATDRLAQVAALHRESAAVPGYCYVCVDRWPCRTTDIVTDGRIQPGRDY